MKIITLFILSSVVFSCGQESDKNESSDPVLNTESKFSEESVVEETVEYEELFNPEIEYDGRLLEATTYHEDEITNEPEMKDWIGLFKDNSGEGFSLWKTDLNFDKVEDPIMDDGGDSTGWEVSSSNVQDPLFFFGGLDYLSEGSVVSCELEKAEIYPGDMLKFSFLDVDYQMYATGQKVLIEEDYYQVENYKLFLMTAVDGEKRTSQISDQTGFDDAMVSILFAGDIDKDGFLDLIINDTYHYNVSNPTLLLSKPAVEGQTLKSVAAHRSTGC
jgi:hypothetical protein